MQLRLQKFLSECGATSRRQGETLILEGRVTVNGQVIRKLGTKVDSDHDAVRLNGHLVKPQRKVYLAFNKPRGFLCTRTDPDGRPTITDLLPPEHRSLYSVGRLDFNSEGLLLLTNDGNFALKLTHPRYGVKKTYVVDVDGLVGPEQLRALTQGVHHQGELLRALSARSLHARNQRSIVELKLNEGKNREVRRLFEALGLHVDRLTRTQVGSLSLGRLKTGQWRILTAAEVNSLLVS
jgi:23S rRNA pseudouridine2605 synthase